MPPTQRGKTKAPAAAEAIVLPRCLRGYFAAGVAFSAYLRRKRSTRPAVSTRRCLPVKNGWQLEQISTLILPLWVERVSKVFPQEQ